MADKKQSNVTVYNTNLGQLAQRVALQRQGATWDEASRQVDYSQGYNARSNTPNETTWETKLQPTYNPNAFTTERSARRLAAGRVKDFYTRASEMKFLSEEDEDRERRRLESLRRDMELLGVSSNDIDATLAYGNTVINNASRYRSYDEWGQSTGDQTYMGNLQNQLNDLQSQLTAAQQKMQGMSGNEIMNYLATNEYQNLTKEIEANKGKQYNTLASMPDPTYQLYSNMTLDELNAERKTISNGLKKDQQREASQAIANGVTDYRGVEASLKSNPENSRRQNELNIIDQVINDKEREIQMQEYLSSLEEDTPIEYNAEDPFDYYYQMSVEELENEKAVLEAKSKTDWRGATATSNSNAKDLDAINRALDLKKRGKDLKEQDGIWKAVNGQWEGDTDGGHLFYEQQQFDEMTDAEREIFNRIYDQQGRAKAIEFFDWLQEDLNSRDRLNTEAAARFFANEHPVLASAASVGQKLLTPIQVGYQLGDLIEDGSIDQNAWYNMPTYSSNAIRNQISSNIRAESGDGLAWAYQAGMSVADNLAQMAVSGTWLGASFGENVVLGLMGSNVFADSIVEGKDQGKSEFEIIADATVRTLIELATEKMGLDEVMKVSREAGWEQFFKAVVSEGAEEGISDIGNYFYDSIKEVLKGNESLIQQDVERYMEAGYSAGEAMAKAVSQRFKDLGLDVLTGAVSGFMLSGGQMSASYLSENYVKENFEHANEVGKSFSPDSDAYKFAVNSESVDGKLAKELYKVKQVSLNNKQWRQDYAEATTKYRNVFQETSIEDLNTAVLNALIEAESDPVKAGIATAYEEMKTGAIRAEIERTNATVDWGSSADIQSLLRMPNESNDMDATFRLNSGEIVSFDDIEFESEDARILFTNAINHMTKTTDVNNYIEMYRHTNNMPVESFDRMYTTAYNMGSNGLELSAVKANKVVADILDAFRSDLPASTADTVLSNAITDGYASANTVSEAEQKFVMEFAKTLNRSVRFVKGLTNARGEAAEGQYNKKTGEILISTTTQNPAIRVFCHELTHAFENESPELFDEYKKKITEQLSKGETSEAYAAIRESIQETWGFDINDEKLDKKVDSELIAIISEYYLIDEAFVNSVKENKKLYKKLREIIRLNYTRVSPDLVRAVTNGIVRESEQEWFEEVSNMWLKNISAEEQSEMDYDEAQAEMETEDTEYGVNKEFADNQYSLAPPYSGNQKAKLEEWLSRQTDEVRDFYNVVSAVRQIGVKKMGGRNWVNKFMLASEWNENIQTNDSFAKMAQAVADAIPRDWCRDWLNEDGSIIESEFEKEFKMQRSIMQRIVDRLPLTIVSPKVTIDGKEIVLSDKDKIYGLGGEAYRQAIYEERLRLWEADDLPQKGLKGFRKDNWGTLGFLATNTKTGASGDFTTWCPQMFFNKGCFYCYRRAALESGVNNKLVAERVWYVGEILQLKQEDIDMLNTMGGLRIQSFGDWMEQYSPQLAQVLADADRVKLQVKIITKEPSMIDVVARIKDAGIGKSLYFNLSSDYVIEKAGDIQEYKDSEGGALPQNPLRPFYTDEEGTRWWKRALTVEEANEYRQKYPWVNTRIVATTVDEFIRGLKDDMVDVVTGYHGHIRQYERVSSETGETLVQMEALGDSGMPIFELDLETGTWNTLYEGKTKTHKALAQRIVDEGLQYMYTVKTCCITGRCAQCKGKCGRMSSLFGIKNYTNRDNDSVTFWREHMVSAEPNALLDDVQNSMSFSTYLSDIEDELRETLAYEGISLDSYKTDEGYDFDQLEADTFEFYVEDMIDYDAFDKITDGIRLYKEEEGFEPEPEWYDVEPTTDALTTLRNDLARFDIKLPDYEENGRYKFDKLDSELWKRHLNFEINSDEYSRLTEDIRNLKRDIKTQDDNAIAESDGLIQDGNQAVMSAERINSRIDKNGTPTRASSWIARINPTDFLTLTLEESKQDREVFDNMRGSYGSTVNDYDFIEGGLKTEKSQTPFLYVDTETGQVRGHEGRHRLRALEKAGVTSVEIFVEFYDDNSKNYSYNEIDGALRPIDKTTVYNQEDSGQSVVLRDIVPLNEYSRDNGVLREYGYGEENADVSEDDIVYSRSFDDEYLELARDPEKNKARLQEMVDRAAEAAGYNVKAYHGTWDFGKTVFDRWGGVLYLTDETSVARNFSGGQAVRTIAGDFNPDTAPLDSLIEYAEQNTYADGIREATAEDFDNLIERNTPDKNDIKKYGQDIYDNEVRRYEIAKELKADFESGTKYLYMEHNSIANRQGFANLSLFPESRLREFIKEYPTGRDSNGGGVYQMYLRPDNMLEIDVRGNYYTDVPIPDELKPYATSAELESGNATSDQILRMASEAGYETIKYMNMREGGDYGNAGISNVYATLNATENAKSADPVTYDDNGNIIPLSERFNSDNEDIRYSQSFSSIEETNAKMLNELYEALGKEYARPKLSDQQVLKISEKILRGLGAEYSTEALAENLKRVFSYWGRRGNVNYATLTQITQDIMLPVVESIYDYSSDPMKRMALAGNTYIISEETAKKFGGVNAMNKGLTAYGIRFTTDPAAEIEQDRELLKLTSNWYNKIGKELYDGVAETLSLNPELTNEADMVTAILDFMKGEKTNSKRSVIPDYAKEEFAYTLTLRAYEEYIREARVSRADVEKRTQKNVEQETANVLKEIRENVEKKYLDILDKGEQAVLQMKNKQAEKLQKAKNLDKLKKLMKRFKKYVESPTAKSHFHIDYMKYIGQIGDMVDLTSGRKNSKANDTLRALAEEYKRIAMLEVYDTNEYDDTIEQLIQETADMIGDRAIRELNSAEIAQVYNAVRAFIHEAMHHNDLLDKSIAADLEEGLKRTIDDVNAAKGSEYGRINNITNAWVQTSLNPIREIARITDYYEDDPFAIAADKLMRGEIQVNQYKMEMAQIFERMNESNFKRGTDDYARAKEFRKRYDRMNKTFVKVTLSGKEIEITEAQKLALIMHSRNNENLLHILYGGILVPHQVAFKRGDYVEAYARGKIIIPTQNELRNLSTKLDDFERWFLNRSIYYFDSYAKNLINNTSLALEGFLRAEEENYYPIRVADDFHRVKSYDVSTGMMDSGENLNSGMLKKRQKSKAPIYLNGINQDLQRHQSFVSRYAALAIPLRDFQKVYNGSAHDENGKPMPLKRAIRDKWGAGAVQYVDKVLKDMIGGRTEQTAFDKIRSKSAQAVLTLNPSVSIKQTASFPTAIAELDYKSVTKAFFRGGKNNWMLSSADRELIARYTPILWSRTAGLSTQEIAEISFNQNKSKLDKGMEKVPFLFDWIRKMDVATVGRLWYATQYWIDDHTDLEKGTDEYYRAVARKFEDVVTKTQPSYSVFTRPDILRKNSGMMKAVMMFKTQPLQNFGILYESTSKYIARIRQYKAAKGTSIEEQARGRVITARNQMLRAVSSQLIQTGLFTAMSLLANALILHRWDKYRDDETNEVTVASVFEQLGWDYLDSFFGNFFILDWVEDIGSYSVQKFVEKDEDAYLQGLSVFGIDAVNDLIDLFDKVGTYAVNGDGEKTWQTLFKFGMKVSQLWGIPAENVYKMEEGIRTYVNDALEKRSILELQDTTPAQYWHRVMRAYEKGEDTTALFNDMIEKTTETKIDKKGERYTTIKAKSPLSADDTSGVMRWISDLYVNGSSADKRMVEDWLDDLYDGKESSIKNAKRRFYEYLEADIPTDLKTEDELTPTELEARKEQQKQERKQEEVKTVRASVNPMQQAISSWSSGGGYSLPIEKGEDGCGAVMAWVYQNSSDKEAVKRFAVQVMGYSQKAINRTASEWASRDLSEYK